MTKHYDQSKSDTDVMLLWINVSLICYITRRTQCVQFSWDTKPTTTVQTSM